MNRSPPSNPIFGFKRRCSVSGETFGEQVSPEPPSKLILQNSLRNSDLNRWGYGWEHVSHCLELILLTFWDREVGVGGRGNLLSPQITEKRRGGSGGGIPPSPERRGEGRLTSFASPPFIPREPLIPPTWRARFARLQVGVRYSHHVDSLSSHPHSQGDGNG